jgi:hypothetical protein
VCQRERRVGEREREEGGGRERGRERRWGEGERVEESNGQQRVSDFGFRVWREIHSAVSARMHLLVNFDHEIHGALLLVATDRSVSPDYVLAVDASLAYDARGHSEAWDAAVGQLKDIPVCLLHVNLSSLGLCVIGGCKAASERGLRVWRGGGGESRARSSGGGAL